MVETIPSNYNAYLYKSTTDKYLCGNVKLKIDDIENYLFGLLQILQTLADIAEIYVFRPLIFTNRRPNFALRQKPFGISHRFCFIEAHCGLNASEV